MIVTTGTASGKSLCFNLPTLDVLCRDRRARALYLYPTKALAQDQARALAALGLAQVVRPAIYDGDTPPGARAQIRRTSNVILTNPDMLHLGILPNHGAWGELFANLAVVVVDEAHVYRGVFGSHVANVLRRLRRIAAAYGTAPRFLLASATIANPLELAERLTGFETLTLIERDGSPRSRRRIAIWNPPVIDAALGQRRSALAEGAELLARLVAGGARTICFVRSRKGVELVHRMAQAELERIGAGELAGQITPYRAGYTAAQRREIERRLSGGELAAVITTDALELGIDVGGLDAAVVHLVPGHRGEPAPDVGAGGAARAAAWPSTSPARTRSTSSSAATPTSSSTGRWRRRSSTTKSRRSTLQHLVCAAHEGPAGPGRRRRVLRARAVRGLRRAARSAPASCGASDAGVRRAPARATIRPARSRCARRRRRRFVLIEAQHGRGARGRRASRAYSTLHEGAVYFHLGQRLHRPGARPRVARRLVSSRSTATTTRSPRARRRR